MCSLHCMKLAPCCGSAAGLIRNGRLRLILAALIRWRTMTIFTIAAMVIVIGWLTLAALFWASFQEDEQAHPIYRSRMAHNQPGRGPVSHPEREG